MKLNKAGIIAFCLVAWFMLLLEVYNLKTEIRILEKRDIVLDLRVMSAEAFIKNQRNVDKEQNFRYNQLVLKLFPEDQQ